MSALGVVLLFGLLVAGTAVTLFLAGRLDPVRSDADRDADRPRWGRTPVWLVACAVFAFLGLVVAPRLFGVVVLFLPFIWMRRGRRGAGRDGRGS